MKLSKQAVKDAMLLYAVTDRAWLGAETLPQQVEKAIKGGATCVQLREKNITDDEFLSLAFQVKEVCAKYGVPFIVNDNVKVAIEVGADGVHIGQDDMNAAQTRELIGPDMVLGVSAATVEQAQKAVADGADYLGVGSVFTTSTKLDADAVSIDTLKDICVVCGVPVVAIGGINRTNAHKLSVSGVDGIAVVSAIFRADDIEASAKELRQLAEKL